MSSAAVRPESSSSVAAASSASEGGADFWCHECDMSVSVLPASSSVVCPNCGGDFLEEMEMDFQPRRSRSLQAPSGTLIPVQGDEEFDRIRGFDDLMDFPLRGTGRDIWEEPSSSNIEDYYEVFDRLLSYIVSSTSDDHGEPALEIGDCGIPRPAAKSYVESIPGVEITEEFIAADPFLLCAVCKEEFVLQTEARRLPCGHIYHQDCILPWLSRHNSCPVCRFRLPTDDPVRRRHLGEFPAAAAAGGGGGGREDQVERDVREIHRMLRSLFPGRNPPPAEEQDWSPDLEVDFLGIGPILRRIAARHRLPFSGSSPEPPSPGSSASRLAQVEQASNGPASSSETVSSVWTRDEGTSAAGGAAAAAAAAERSQEERDLDVAEARTFRN